jgi:hypothetical protein
MKAITILLKFGCGLVDLNRRAAIRERRLNCTGWNKEDVKNCEFEGECSLHPFRSGNGKQDPHERDKAIKDHCKS